MEAEQSSLENSKDTNVTNAASSVNVASTPNALSAPNAPITPKQFYSGDLLAVGLRDKLHMNSFWIFVFLVSITLLCFYVLYIVLPDLVPKLVSISAHLVNQIIFALLETFTACLFFTAYVWFPEAVCSLFESLKNNEVLDETISNKNNESIEGFLKPFLLRMNSIWWLIIILAFIFFYIFYRALTGGPPFIQHVPLWLQIITAVLDGLVAYCGIMSIIRLTILISLVNLLFRSSAIHIKPLHPDGSGGLAGMRSILWIIAATILGTTLVFSETIQISLANNIPFSPLDALMLAAAYLILAPSLLISWLVLPHYVMLKDRQETLLPLMKEFQQIASSSSVTQKTASEILKDTDSLSAIKQRYDLLSKTFPIWPVEITQVRSVIAALSLPVLIPLVPYIVNVLQFIGGFLPK